MKTIIVLSTVLIPLVTHGPSASASTVEVIDPGVSDHPSTICEFTVVEYKDASVGGGEWTVAGSGSQGGSAASLWLFSTSLTASTHLVEETTAVAFMMVNDDNDGIARFSVDGEAVADIDMFSQASTRQTIVVTDLAPAAHTLSVRYLGSRVGIAILGGGALRLSDDIDADNDNVMDHIDNCIGTPNTAQRDTDGDGYGNACDTDLNNDCFVNFIDLNMIAEVFFLDDPDADFDGDGTVNFVDLNVMAEQFFLSPGPSATTHVCGC